LVNYFDFNVLNCLIKINATLENKTPLRIGRGSEVKPGGLDLAVERDYWDRVYIPGSSIKGVMRSLVEKIARAQGLEVCNPLDITSRRLEDEKGPCIVCGIFGGGGVSKNSIASHVHIFDAYPKEDVKTATRTRVAIDRFRQAARHGALFTYEYVPPGIKWSFEMHIYNIDIIDGDEEKDPRIKLLRALFKYLYEFGLQVGSMRSVGLGLLTLVDGVIEKYVIEDLRLKLVKKGKLIEEVRKW